jgi:threonine dehydratase
VQFDVTLDHVVGAAGRIAGRVRATPSYRSPALTGELGREAVVKLECLQLAGSFKVRGVFNRLLAMADEERTRGVVTVSGGNHAIAVAEVGRALGIPARVYMPEATPAYNVEQARQRGAEVVLTADAATGFARAEADGAAGRTYIHPYDDPLIIAGHGTVGLEMAAQEPHLTHAFIAIGGGGFAAGVAAALKARLPHIRLIGVETEGATTMTEALAAGKPVPIRPTSIARTLGAPFVTERTLAAAATLLDRVVVVPDGAVVRDLHRLLETEKLLVEPAAACVLTAARQLAPELPGDAVIGLILCGSNVDWRMLAEWRERVPGA